MSAQIADYHARAASGPDAVASHPVPHETEIATCGFSLSDDPHQPILPHARHPGGDVFFGQLDHLPETRCDQSGGVFCFLKRIPLRIALRFSKSSVGFSRHGHPVLP